MSTRNFSALFEPRSVAVIGASSAEGSLGRTLVANIAGGGFDGPVMPVNPKYRSIAGILAYPDIGALPETPDLAVICTPPATVPAIIGELAERGTRAAIVITAGLDRIQDNGTTVQERALQAARTHRLRILGPNCVGLIVPRSRLNASFAHAGATPGRIAFVTQSGALATAVLDYANSAGIGFSTFMSLGNCADVDFGDALDYLCGDPDTEAILLYIESIREARKFMSAARAAARAKPVIAVKSGRVEEGRRAAASHTGALAGSDDVIDAALRRAGILRVDTIEELFSAVETLGRAAPPQGDGLAIVTNGGGPGVMATDALIRAGGRLATLQPETISALDGVLPPNWSRANPVDIIGDAGADRYREALRLVAADGNVDTLLLIHAPLALVSATELARGLIPAIRQCAVPVLTNWLGRDGVTEARRLFAENGIATYDTPEEATRAFLHLVAYRCNQQLLSEVPQAVRSSEDPISDRSTVRSLLERARREQRTLLSEPESKKLLEAFGIPVVRTREAADPEACSEAASHLDAPYALKIVSPDLTHKSDVGGVVLNLPTADDVVRAARLMKSRLRREHPAASLEGFSVQEMVNRPDAIELIVGMSTDPVFGPTLLFGEGGTAVEIVHDQVVGFPPLNATLARDLVGRTRVSRRLAGYRGIPPADSLAVTRVLMALGEIASTCGGIRELDINPLLADSEGVIALDARVVISPEPCNDEGNPQMAIRPYPADWDREFPLGERSIRIRPALPQDGGRFPPFFAALDSDRERLRLVGTVGGGAHTEIARWSQLDFDREMVFLACDQGQRIVGAARSVTDAEGREVDFVLAVVPGYRRKGIGGALLDVSIRYWASRGAASLRGRIADDSPSLTKLARAHGFTKSPHSEGGSVAEKSLTAAAG